MEASYLLLMTLALPLLGALLAFFLGERFFTWGVTFLALIAANSGWLCLEAFQAGAVAVSAGDWMAPYGIVLIVDPLAALMLLASNVVFFASLLGRKSAGHQYLYPLLFLLQTGVSLSFITGDLFNLFVAFELMLMSSYALLTLHGDPERLGNAYGYLSMNILASFIYLMAVAVFYSATGSLNFAELAKQLQGVPSYPGLVLLLAISFVMFIKGGIFPFYYWLPDSYPILPSYLASIFGGILSKVGIYALFRIYYTVFSGTDYGTFPFLLVMASLTMVLGVLGAVSRSTIKGILSYHILSQVGYMLLALALATPLAIAGGVFFIIHNMLVKSSLFLIGGMAEERCRSGQLKEMGGVWQVAPFVGVLFLLQAFSLAGIPPLSGFWPKYFLFFEGMRLEHYLVVALAVLTSFFTLFSMLKIWNAAFLGEKPQSRVRLKRSAYLGPVVLTILALAIGGGTPWSYKLCRRAANELLNPAKYISFSLQAGSKGRAS